MSRARSPADDLILLCTEQFERRVTQEGGADRGSDCPLFNVIATPRLHKWIRGDE
jgi:hypothetical protein